MSAEKGGALVRSPPGMVGGIDSYNARVGGGTTWEHSTPPHMPPTGGQQQQQRNARVTKISSGDKDTFASKNTRKNRETDKRIVNGDATINDNETEEPCGCEASARARQLEHDLHQLQTMHEVVLKGLHQQVEELKQKNRDMTFQLLMGPYATSVHLDALQSPESDVASQKEENRKEDKSTSTTDNEEQEPVKQQEIGSDKKDHLLEQDELSLEGNKTILVHRRLKRGRGGDPRQVRSLDMELLEEEAEELRRQLEDERAKNKYLLKLTEDMKRHIRDEMGIWNPPPPHPPKKAIQNAAAPLKQPSLNLSIDANKIERITGTGSSFFRLPQIPKIDYHSQKVLGQNLTKAEASSQLQQGKFHQQQTELGQQPLGTDFGNTRSRKGPEKNTVTLPAIGYKLREDQFFRRPEPLKLEDEQTSKQLTGQTNRLASQMILQGKGKFKQRSQPSNLSSDQEKSDENTHSQVQMAGEISYNEVTNKGTKNLPRQNQLVENEDQTKSRQEQRLQQKRQQKTFHSQKEHSKQHPQPEQQSQTKTPPRRRSGSGTRTRGSSGGRSTSSRDSSRTGGSRLRQSPVGVALTSSSVNGEEPPTHSGSKGQRPIKNRRNKWTGSSSDSVPVDASTHTNAEVNLASSSSSAGSLASANERPKNKGRTHRRGRGKNRRNQESKDNKGQ